MLVRREARRFFWQGLTCYTTGKYGRKLGEGGRSVRIDTLVAIYYLYDSIGVEFQSEG